MIKTMNENARSPQFFAGARITRRAKVNEHNIVAGMLSKEEKGYGSKRALDIGCGIGGYFDILLNKGYHVVGFDIAEKMVKVCHSRYGGRNDIELMVADAEHMPLNLKVFDLVLCLDTLQYVNYNLASTVGSGMARESVLKRIVELAKPGGVIIVDVKNQACPAYFLKRFRDILVEQYSIGSITSVLKSNHCVVEEVRGVFWPTFLSPIVLIKARKSEKSSTD